MPRKFQGLGECRFDGSEKDRYYLKIPNLQHQFTREFKRGKLASFFLDNAPKMFIWAKDFRNIEIKHIFSLTHFSVLVNF